MEMQRTINTELFKLTKMIFVPIYVLTLSTVHSLYPQIRIAAHLSARLLAKVSTFFPKVTVNKLEF